MDLYTLKEFAIEACFDWLVHNRKTVEDEMADLRSAGSEETKSTMGDKHETSKVLVQIEQENLSKRIAHINTLEKDLIAANCGRKPNKVEQGTIVRLDKMVIYLAAAIGELSIGKQKVFAISLASPLGKELLGKSVGDKVHVNGRSFSIEEIA